MARREERRGARQPLRRALRPRGPVRFGIAETREPGSVSFLITGELDVLTVPRLAAQLDPVVRRSKDDVVIDLRGAEFMDSAGLQILLSTQRRLERGSRKLTVRCEHGAVRRVIELARVEEMLGMSQDPPRP